MDSSDLIRQRRNRVEANSYNGQKSIRPANKITQRSWDQQTNINIGGRRVEFNNITILPSCAGTVCSQDLVGYTPGGLEVLEPPIPPNSSISYNLPNCPIDQPTVVTYPVILSPGLPPGGAFTIQLPPPGFGSNPATIDPVTGTITIPSFQLPSTDPTGIYIVTYTLGSFSVQVSLDLQGC